MINERGQAAILIVFVLGMTSVLIGLSLAQTGFRESIIGRTDVNSAKAFYAANSGVEEAFYQIGRDSLYGVAAPENFELTVGEGKADVRVYGTEDQKTIESIGTYQSYARKLKVDVQNTSLTPGFEYAIHAGQGGFELEHNTVITGKNNTAGNVYSRSSVWGAKNDYWPTGECKNAASAVEGSVWAVDKIDKLTGVNDSGICITKDAYAGVLDYCFVKGNPNSPLPPSLDCPYNGVHGNESVPLIPLPDMGVDRIKNYLTSRGTPWPGDCVIDGSGGPADCSGGTNTIGEMVITGNLIKPSNVNIKFSGPVWVKGNIVFNSMGSVGLAPEITEVSQLIVTDGTILSDSNISFGSNGTAFLLFISTFVPTSGELCDTPAITLSSNTNSVLFYSTRGCVLVNANSTFHGAILGEKIHVKNNSTVEYDPALQLAIFGLTKSGGWQTISFKEE